MSVPEQYNRQQLVWKRLRLFRRAQDCGNVSQACREFGVSRKTYYKWQARYTRAGGQRAALQDRSRRPHSHPRQLRGAPLKLLRDHARQRRWRKHLVRLWWHLKSRHALALSVSGLYKALRREGLLQKPQRRRRRPPKPYQAMSRPGERVQVDVKYTHFYDAKGQRLYQYTALDEYSRWRLLRFFPECTPQASLAFFAELQAHFPFPIACLQTDHGTEFTYDFMPQHQRPHPLTEHLERLGIRHKLIRIATPWHNGKVERSHRTDQEEFYALVHPRTVREAHRRLASWNRRYNQDRPHGALGWKTPHQMLLDYQQSLAEGVTHH
jgi:transposase InsO family protein